MIQYLNANQGFVMAILTAVYVLATLVLVIVAHRQFALTQRSLDFASAAEKTKSRPYVLFDIVYEEMVNRRGRAVPELSRSTRRA